jgi:hypothetical protein
MFLYLGKREGSIIANGAFTLKERVDGSIQITQEDYSVGTFGEMDVEANYTLDKENAQKLRDYLRKSYSERLKSMMTEEFGRYFEKKSFSKVCDDNGIIYKSFVWLDALSLNWL